MNPEVDETWSKSDLKELALFVLHIPSNVFDLEHDRNYLSSFSLRLPQTHVST